EKDSSAAASELEHRAAGFASERLVELDVSGGSPKSLEGAIAVSGSLGSVGIGVGHWAKILRARIQRQMAIPSEGDVQLRHVAIDGPIGVGKTSLVDLLARRFHGTKVLEDVDNPFLADFYRKKTGSAFQTQLFFLLSRYQQQREIAQIDLFTNLVLADYHF